MPVPMKELAYFSSSSSPSESCRVYGSLIGKGFNRLLLNYCALQIRTIHLKKAKSAQNPHLRYVNCGFSPIFALSLLRSLRFSTA
jgi:hypothetical protein